MSQFDRKYYTSSDEVLSASKAVPLTYIDWLQYETTFDKEVAFEQYSIYLTEWYANKGIDAAEVQSEYVRNLYINLLKQIALEYTTADEKRFLTNIDYDDDKDLDIALPFFAKKLKQIAIYYAEQRDEIRHAPIKANLKGSSYGIGQLVYKKMTDILRYDPEVQSQLTDLDLTLVDVLTNLKIDLTDLYDTEQNYYNIPNEANSEDYSNVGTSRYNYFTLSSLPNRVKLFLAETYTESLIELIRSVPVLLQSGTRTSTGTKDEELQDRENRALAITDIITGTELDRLDPSTFYDYTSENNLNITYEQLAFQKYSGTDYYYLSTGDTLTDTVSGKLFDAPAPHKELLNRFYPTIVTAPGENLYKQQYVGGFFTTTGVGLVNYTSLDYTYRFKPEKNATYYFPDPQAGAAGFYGSYKSFDTPVVYYENINWNKQQLTSHYNYGLQKQFKNILRFNPYQSSDDTMNHSTAGVSKHTDKIDFWSDNGTNTWTQQDIFEIAEDYTQPLTTRQDSLLTGNKTVYKWKTDIFGNNYILTKSGIDPDYKTPVNTNNNIYETQYIDSDTTPQGSRPNLVQLQTDPDHVHNTENITDQKSLTGTLYMRNNTASSVQTLTSASLSGIYSKYDSEGTICYRGKQISLSDIKNDILNNLINIDIVYDVLILETTDYIIFEKIAYNYDTTTISSGTREFAFLAKRYHTKYDTSLDCSSGGSSRVSTGGVTTTTVTTTTSTDTTNTVSNYEHASNWWFDEDSDRILISKSTVHPTGSSTCNRMIYPELYSYAIKTGKLDRIYPDPDFTDPQVIYETSQYSLSALSDSSYDITSIKPPVLAYNRDSERFSVTYIGTDPVENMYMVKTDFRLYDQSIELININFYKNNYTTYTMNAANPVISETFISETNPSLADTYYHDTDRETLFLCASANNDDPVPRPNSSCVWTYGNITDNFIGERNIAISFDFAMSGSKTSPSNKPDGLSVVFFRARKLSNIGHEELDDGGTGKSFSYLADSSIPSLSGLDSGHACVTLDAQSGSLSGSIAGDDITVFGPYDTVEDYRDATSLDATDFNLYQDVTDKDYNDLQYTRCRVTLTNLGRTINVHMKSLQGDDEYSLVHSADMSQDWTADYTVPRRLKVALAGNTSSSNPGVIAIKNITVTGSGRADLEYATA
jgi:hypothetical protein